MLLYTNASFVISLPKSSAGSAQRMSHMGPELGGSRKRSIWHPHDGKESSVVMSPHSTPQRETAPSEWTRPHLANVVEGLDLGGQPAVQAEELLVHERRQRQRIERDHDGVVQRVVVLVEA